jgi:succinyl-CoA synthetase alpha subunit
MLNAGSSVVGGTNPKKAGEVLTAKLDAGGSVKLPVFATVQEAKDTLNANCSVVFVPPRFAKAAIVESVEANIELIVVITEGIPLQDSAYCVDLAKRKREEGVSVRILGPNCPGLVTPPTDTSPGSNVGIIPDSITRQGPVGLVSKSGTLTYQMLSDLSDVGFSTGVGIGGDPAVGTSQIECLELFEEDPDTKLIVMIGEIGGDAEELAAEYIKQHVSKPVVAYIAGFEAPVGKAMGHAGAIVSGSSGTAQSKKTALESVGVKVGETPTQTAAIVRSVLKSLV